MEAMENPAKRAKLMSSEEAANDNISQFSNLGNSCGSFDYSDFLTLEPKSFADCVQWARLDFEQKFSLCLDPAAGQNARSRSPIVFDVNDVLHLTYIIAASNNRAKSYGITKLYRREEIAKIVIQLEDKIQEIKFNAASGEAVLPNEMWHCVFKNLKLADLKNVSLACKRFHEIIADSIGLMKHFEIRLSSETDPKTFDQVMEKSIRKYQNVKCDGSYNVIYLDLIYLNFFAENPIKTLEIYSVECSEDTFAQIMNAVKDTLEFIDIHKIHFSTESEIEFKPIEWKKLKTVHFWNIDDCLFKYLPLTIQNLRIENIDEEMESLTVQFINKQKKLRELRLIDWIQPKEFSKKVEFEVKLDSLYLHLSSEDESSNGDLQIVLQNQFDCLRILELWNTVEFQQLAAVINKMEKLEKLILSDINFTISEDENPTKMFCPTLKSLTFTSVKPNKENRINSVLEAFPNLEELEVTGSEAIVTPELISKCNPNLKRLDLITDYDLAGVILPNLLELNVHYYEDFSQQLDYCPNLKKIVVFNCVYESTLRAILKSAKNLKCLIVLNGSKLSQNTIKQNEHLLKNLEELRIYNFEQPTKASNTLLAKHLTLRSYITSEDYSW